MPMVLNAVSPTQTMLVVQAAEMLGFPVERINFSANISMESLAGGYMPRVVDGRRTFEASVPSCIVQLTWFPRSGKMGRWCRR